MVNTENIKESTVQQNKNGKRLCLLRYKTRNVTEFGKSLLKFVLTEKSLLLIVRHKGHWHITNHKYCQQSNHPCSGCLGLRLHFPILQ